VVSYQTAEDGAGTKCAPSYAIRGGLPASTSNSAPETGLMLLALARGWTVVAPDYQGPQSMFLGARGEAHGVLDGLTAARGFAPAGIDRKAPLALWGYSGGAFASTSAAQLQPRYAPRLKLSGVALGGTVADLRKTIHAFSGSPFGGALLMGFVTVNRAYPEYHLTRYLNAAALEAMKHVQTDCITDAVPKYPFASLEQYTDNPEVIDGPELEPMFHRINPLTQKGVPAAPVYEYHARGDELAPIGPARALVNRFCKKGVVVQHVEDLLTEHIGFVVTGAPGAVQYMADRFAGKPAPSTC
jgi:acetyl esterase/lipase